VRGSGRVHRLVRAASAFVSALAGREEGVRSQGEKEDRSKKTEVRIVEATPKPSGFPFTEAPQAGVENKCPVCQARFRGMRICSRCGADLEPLMRMSVQAWQLRQSAREALGSGDVERGLGFAVEAQGIQDTESGEGLRLLGAWLKTSSSL
jgi:hypothetical protein